MIVIAGLLGGAGFGAALARRRGGKALDMAQYGAGFGICFGLIGLFATILIDRLT